MTTDQINYMNVGLMIASAAIAMFLPFELFLFSYVVLGPLHYLTELSWLHKRRYFSPGKRDYILLAVLSGLILLPTVFRLAYTLSGHGDVSLNPTYNFIATGARVMIFVAFAASAVLVIIRDSYKRAIAIALAVVVGFLSRTNQFVTVLFALFIPTLIHVFVFTGVFIFVGALKSRSLSGILSLLAFVGCGAALLVIYPHAATQPGTGLTQFYDLGFFKLNKQIFATFLHRNASRNDIYYSGPGLMITRFIAYAYTYHYLNWFSKTSVIKWHLVPKRSLILVITIWVLAVALYFADYFTGFTVLYFLSVLHVIFEFPLNFQSFRDTGRLLTGRSVKPA